MLGFIARAALFLLIFGLLPSMGRAQADCSAASALSEWSGSELARTISQASDGWLKEDSGGSIDRGALRAFTMQDSNGAVDFFNRMAFEARWGWVPAEGVIGDARRSRRKEARPMAALVDAHSRETEGSMTNPLSCSGVVLATGEKVTPQSDFASSHFNGLSMTRTFRSNGAAGYFFGPNWATEYDPVYYSVSREPCVLTESGCYPPSITVKFPSGASYTYMLNMAAQAGEYSVLGSAALGLVRYALSIKAVRGLYMKDRSYNFDTNRRMTRASGPDGAKVEFTYDANSKISTITNAAGQTLKLTWVAGKVTKVVDPAGYTWSYEYNANEQLIKVTSPGSPADIREYHHEHAADAKLLTGVSINGARYSTYKYDSSKRVTESSLAGSEHKDKFTYALNQTTLTNALGLATVFKFTTTYGGKRLTSASNSAHAACSTSAASVIAYDAKGYVDYTTDWNNNKTDYTFDTAGRLTSATTAAGTAQAKLIKYTWNTTTDKVSEVNHHGNSTTPYLKVAYTYSGTRLASETETDLKFGGGTRSVTYAYTNHASGAIATKATTRPMGGGGTATSIETYDSKGNLVTLKNPLGQTVSWSGHDGLGRPGQMLDANNVATSFGYDARGNHISTGQTLPTGLRSTTYAYNNNHQVTDVTSPTGAVVRLRYNAAMQVEKTGNTEGEYELRHFDLATRTVTSSATRERPSLNGATPVAVTEGVFKRTTVLDSHRRPSVERGNAGQSITTTYDGNGNVKSRTDVANRTTLFDYDAQNRLIRTTSPDGGITENGHDNEGRLKYVKDPRGLQTNFTYNGFGERLTLRSPDTGMTTTTYDPAGRVTSELRAGGQSISYTHDAAGRLTSRTVGSYSEAFGYDAGAYGIGRLTSFRDGTGTTSHAYDAAGQMLEQRNVIDGQTYLTTWEYDSAGRLLHLNAPTGMVVKFTWDTVGRVSQMDG